MPVIFNDLILRQINQTDNTKKFSLGNENHTPLKIFLQKEALDFHQYEIAKTFVLINNHSPQPSKVLGYITLMNSEVALNVGERPQHSTATKKYQSFSAVKIARLAIDKTLQHQGYGRTLLDWCINHIQLTIMPNVGCRFLVVDAKRDSISFYQKSGFNLLDKASHHKNEHPMMFLDLFKSH